MSAIGEYHDRLAHPPTLRKSLALSRILSGPWIFIISLFLCSLAIPKETLGGSDFSNPQVVSSRGLGTFLANAFPTNPMIKGMNELKVAPGIFNYDIDGREGGEQCDADQCSKLIQTEDGKGLALSLTHAFGPHFGVGITGAYIDAEGEIGAGATGPTDTPTLGQTDSRLYSGPIEESGVVVGLGMILDPFSDPDGTRLPFTLGLSYTNLSLEWDVPFIYTTGSRTGDRGQEVGSLEYSSLGAYAALSFQFNTGPFRWSTYSFASRGFQIPKYDWTQRDLDTGESVSVRKSGHWDTSWVFGFGIPVTYRPWGLSFNYVAHHPGDWAAKALTAYILSWSKKW
ncbi:MAG: hypothetical protein ACE5GF_06175 [Thermodesulfobacteriota bacterium]